MCVLTRSESEQVETEFVCNIELEPSPINKFTLPHACANLEKPKGKLKQNL